MSNNPERPFDVARCFGDSWLALKTAPLPLLLGGLVMSCTESGGGGGGGQNSSWTEASGVENPFAGLDSLEPWAIALIALAVCFLLVFVFCVVSLRAWLNTGYIRLHQNVLTAGSDDFTPLFSGADRFWRMLGWFVVSTLIMMAVVFAAVLPGGLVMGVGVGVLENESLTLVGLGLMFLLVIPVVIYVSLGLSLTDRVIALEDVGIMDSIRRSWELTNGRRWEVFLFLFVFGLFRFASVILGLLMCCVGLLATLPASWAMSGVAFTEAYLRLTREPEEIAGWAIGN